MKYMLQLVFVSAFFVALTTGACWGQSKAAAPSIEPQAEKIMRAMNAQKQKDIRASLEIVDTMDEVAEFGQKIQYCHVRKLKVSEPKRFWIESTGDITNTTIWKDDMSFTLLDRSANAYAQAPAPGTIDETMDMLLDTYGVTTPLADLLSNDLYDVLMKNATTCRYLGKHSVDGIPCHHIAAMQKNIDWQIWIDAGDMPQLRKIIITYKQKPGSPQYTAVLKSFNEVSQLPGDTFTFKAPEGAKKIPFLPVKKPAKKASAKQQ
jgi:hypothetical protein